MYTLYQSCLQDRLAVSRAANVEERQQATPDEERLRRLGREQDALKEQLIAIDILWGPYVKFATLFWLGQMDPSAQNRPMPGVGSTTQDRASPDWKKSAKGHAWPMAAE